MLVDNNENLIINIEGKTQLFSKKEVKKCLKVYLSIKNEGLTEDTFCKKYLKKYKENN